jgi:ketol-acid reductoisomerase
MNLETIQSKTVAILGYGNQGRAHALNLRDSGVRVLVGARPEGRAWGTAKQDGFNPLPFVQAAQQADVVMFLLPDQTIAPAFRDLAPVFEAAPKQIGFAHGFAFHFGGVPVLAGCGYFLVAPKGAGAMLRGRFESGSGLPTTFAVAPGSDEATRAVAESYAFAIAGRTSLIRETTFPLETEGDLFGEQVVLVGGLMELMRSAFETLVRNGHPAEMAFFDVCQEVQVTVDLFLKHGPVGMAEKISPTALYGAATRGPRVIDDAAREQMQKIFDEVRSGEFARELLGEFQSGGDKLEAARNRDKGSVWEETYNGLKPQLS